LVLFDHMPEATSPNASWLEIIASGIARVGWIGVDLFFVLSGFLISRLLFQELERTGQIRLGRFWLRRGFKIWPSYFVAYMSLVAVWVVSNRVFHRGDGQGDTMLAHIGPNLVFIQNYFPFYWRWPHSWSLAVEEHFYLLLPVALVLANGFRRVAAKRNRYPSIFRAGIAFCVVALAVRLFAIFEWPAPRGDQAWLATYYPSHTHADGLVLGVLLGYAAHEGLPLLDWIRRYAWALIAFALVTVAVVYIYPVTESPFTYTAGFSLLAVAFTGVVGVAYVHPNGGTTGARWRTAIPRAIAALGVYSYTIYLSHSVVPNLPGYLRAEALTRSLFGNSVWSDRALFFIGSIATGVALSHIVERPALRWRSKLVPSGSRIAAAATVRAAQA
jgi:peptidoglycan/LPS O-acetylase OafA/YrhL